MVSMTSINVDLIVAFAINMTATSLTSVTHGLIGSITVLLEVIHDFISIYRSGQAKGKAYLKTHRILTFVSKVNLMW